MLFIESRLHRNPANEEAAGETPTASLTLALDLLWQGFDVQIELEAAGLLDTKEHPDVDGSSVC